VTEDAGRTPAGGAQLTDARIAIRLADLLLRRLHHQWVVHEERRFAASQQPREIDLPARRVEQVLAPNYERDALTRVIGRRDPLIRPVADTVANEDVPALLVRPLLLLAKQAIVESLDRRLDAHAPADAVPQRKTAIAAAPRVRCALELASRAVAGVDEPLRDERGQRVEINQPTVALPALRGPAAKTRSREDVGCESEPIEIVEHRRFELRLAALAIVIFDAQQHAAAERTREPPDENGVDGVADVEEAGRGRGEARERRGDAAADMPGERRAVDARRGNEKQ